MRLWDATAETIREDYPCVLASQECVVPRVLVWCGWLCTVHAVRWAFQTACPQHESVDVLIHADKRKLCLMCGRMVYWLGGHPHKPHELICEDCAMTVFQMDRILTAQEGA